LLAGRRSPRSLGAVSGAVSLRSVGNFPGPQVPCSYYGPNHEPGREVVPACYPKGPGGHRRHKFLWCYMGLLLGNVNGGFMTLDLGPLISSWSRSGSDRPWACGGEKNWQSCKMSEVGDVTSLQEIADGISGRTPTLAVETEGRDLWHLQRAHETRTIWSILG
jgi:hypothetical protein